MQLYVNRIVQNVSGTARLCIKSVLEFKKITYQSSHMYIKLLIGHNIITTEYFHRHIIMFM